MTLITGSADQTAKLWNVETGAQLFTFNFDSPARSVDFAVGDKLAVITTDPFMELNSAIHVKRIARDPADRMFTAYLSSILMTCIFLLYDEYSQRSFLSYTYLCIFSIKHAKLLICHHLHALTFRSIDVIRFFLFMNRL